MKGLEPSRGVAHQNLNLARLPIPPHPRLFGTVQSFERQFVIVTKDAHNVSKKCQKLTVEVRVVNLEFADILRRDDLAGRDEQCTNFTNKRCIVKEHTI